MNSQTDRQTDRQKWYYDNIALCVLTRMLTRDNNDHFISTQSQK